MVWAVLAVACFAAWGVAVFVSHPSVLAWVATAWQNLKPKTAHERSGAWIVLASVSVLGHLLAGGPLRAIELAAFICLGATIGWYQREAALEDEDDEEGDDANDDGYDGGDGSSS